MLLGTIMFLLATRFIIRFSQYLHKKRECSTGIRRKCLPCLQYLPQIAVAITVTSIAVAIIVVIHLTRLQNLTIFRKFGYAFKYITVLATFLLTVLTPWQLLINHSSFGPSPDTSSRDHSSESHDSNRGSSPNTSPSEIFSETSDTKALTGRSSVVTKAVVEQLS